MTASNQLLEQYDDAVLGKLTWKSTGWRGSIELTRQPIRLRLELEDEALCPTRQLAAIAFAKPLVAKLQQVEPQFRQQAAQEIAEAAASQAKEEQARQYLTEVERSIATLQPTTLVILLDSGGQLEYQAIDDTFFSATTIIVRFDQQANYDEVELVENFDAVKDSSNCSPAELP